MRPGAAIVCIGALALAGCVAAPAPAPMASQTPPEHRWATGLDTRLCPDEETTKTALATCPRVREGYTIVGKSERRDLVAYQVRTDSGKTGWVEYIDYITGSESDADHARRIERAAAAKTAKAECDRKGGVAVGMTRAQLYASCWGKPQRINRTLTGSADHEQLVYPGWNYVYLRDGIVTSIQTSAR